MLRTADNVFSVVLDDSTKQAGNLPAVGTVVSDSNLEEGAIVAVDAGMRRMDAAALAAADRYRIVQGKGTGKQLMISPMITKASATLSTSIHRVAVQQVSIVGFNGTTGSLPAANSTDYFIKIRKNDNDAANRSQPMSLFAGPIKSDASATQEEVAFALVKNGQANFAKEPANGYLKFDVISDGTTAAIGTATLAATNGSTALTYSAAHSLAVGDLVFIAGATYQVAAVPTTTTVTLSTPFEGTTVTALATGTTYATNHGKLTAAANFGVRLTGVQADFDVNAFRDYYVNRFTVTFSDESTLITTTGARTGSGVWQQVAMDEYMSYGFEGENSMLGVPPRMRDQAVIEGNKYGCMEISWTEDIRGLVSLQGGKGSVLVYVDLGTSGAFPATQSTGEELVVDVFGFADSDFEE
jgi:hypothetical protein